MAIVGKHRKAGIEQALADIRDSAAALRSGATEAGNIVQGVVDDNVSFITDQYNKSRSYLEPFFNAGLQGLNQFKNLTGLNGIEAERSAVQGIIKGPSVQGAIDLGVKAIERSNSAKGLTRSGNALVELQQFGEKTAFGFINDRVNALLGITQVGQRAGSQLASMSQTFGQNIAQQKLIGADAQANAAITRAQATSNEFLASSPLKRSLVDPFFGLGDSINGGGGSGGGGGFTQTARQDPNAPRFQGFGLGAQYVQGGGQHYFQQPGGQVVGLAADNSGGQGAAFGTQGAVSGSLGGGGIL